MGIASTVNKWTYTLNGTTTVYPYTTKIFAQTDLVVQIVGTTTTTLTLTTNYSVSGAGEDSGGSVTLVSAGSSGDKLVIRKVLPLTQTTDLVENDPNRAEVMENALDRMVLIAQQINENVQRAVVRDVTQTTQVTLPTPSANKLIGWDSAGTGLENKTTLDADVQTACETAQTAAETAQGLAEDARDAAIVAQGLAEDAAEAAELIADLEVASEAEAQAGTDNGKMMTPLRTAQAITALQDDDIPSSYLDTDADLAADSDVKVPSQKAVKAYVDNSASSLKSELFVANGTFNVPAGVTTVYITGTGGGGGGNGGASGHGASGGGGAGANSVIKRMITVTPEDEIIVTLGTGGTGGTNRAAGGGNGGNTTFGGLLTISGGAGAIANTSTGGTGQTNAISGASATSNIGGVGGGAVAGGSGGNGNTTDSPSGGGGGGGGGSLFGLGGTGGTNSVSGGGNGLGFGAGGGGAGSSGAQYDGGNGSNGFLLVEWF